MRAFRLAATRACASDERQAALAEPPFGVSGDQGWLGMVISEPALRSSPKRRFAFIASINHRVHESSVLFCHSAFSLWLEWQASMPWVP